MTLLSCVAATVTGCAGGGRDSAVLEIGVLRGPTAVETIQLTDSLSRCSKAGIEVKMFDEPLLLRKEMMEGNVDFAFLPMTMAALMYNKGTDYRLVAVPLWGSLYLCGTDTTITGISGLRGKKVSMMARGMTPDILLRHLLKKKGLEPGIDVTLDYRFPTHLALASAAMAGKTGLCILSEPFLSQALCTRRDLHILADLGQQWSVSEGTALAETAFLCKGETVDLHSSTIPMIIKAMRRSCEWVKAHSDSAAALAAAYGINPDSDAVRASIPRCGFDFVPTCEAESEIKCYLRVFMQDGPESIGGKMPDEKFFVK